MTQHDPHLFDDPALKRHCCAVWSCECAPKFLRDKLAAMLAEESIPKTIKPPAAFWQRPFAGVAAAAVVLLVSGVILMQGSSSHPAQVAIVDPQLAADMVYRHDDCCTHHANHQTPGVPKTDMAKLGQVLSKDLRAPVLVASIPESGWSFRGGAVCPVGKIEAGHLIFDRGKASVSVFSMPRNYYTQKTGRYQALVNNHAIAGFADSRGTFCLVASGDSQITPDRLAALRDRMQADVVSAVDSPARVTVAELLH